MRRSLALILCAGVLCVFAPALISQSAQLRVLSATPNGELNQLSEAREIRVIFSEPMVALGRVPSNPTPPWIHITPAVKGLYRWSGTSVLVFTPDPAAPLPNSTRYNVTIDASAENAAGRTLGAPVTFGFTTPTVKLTSLRWYRRDGRFDRPVVLAAEFNQPVQPGDVLAHARVRYQPHGLDDPEVSPSQRQRMALGDPTGVARFDAKLASARQAARRSDEVAVRLTDSWDRQRFPAKASLVVFETASIPPPGAWLELTIDNQVSGVEGSAHPTEAQASTVELPPMFFATRFSCWQSCTPSSYNGVQFTVSVAVARFAASLTVRDITNPARETLVPRRTAAVRDTERDQAWSLTIEDAGYEQQPPITTYAYRLDPALQATDGQTLGYPWVGIVENWHETAFASFGDGHGVWEAAGGSTLPFSSRNFMGVTQWLMSLPPSELVPRIVALAKSGFREVPPTQGAARRLNMKADAIQAHGLNLGSVLSSGRGIVWAGLEPGQPIARARRAMGEELDQHSTIVQVTNLGITVKDSPQSTLVFVTRLDNGAAVPGAAITVVNTDNKELWRGTTGADGVALAPALPLRRPDDWYGLSFVVMAERDGDVAYVASDWNEGIRPWDFGHSYQLWESTDILRGSVFTDRGVYKPGEEVHVKAIVRTDTPNGVRLLPAGSSLDIRVTDSRGREVDRRSVTLNRWSGAEWTWTVPADATLGNYSLRALLPGTERSEIRDREVRRTQADWLRQVSGSFLVAAYRRPDFRVDATLSAGTSADAPISGSLEARYLFGGAMSGRPVSWSITREPTVDIPAPIREKFPDDRYAFGYYPDRRSGPERVVGGDAKLDAAGGLKVTAASARDVDFAYQYMFEGDVEDVSRQHIANRATAVVHPAPWYVGVRRPSYFANTATGTSVEVVAADFQGKATIGVPITLTLTRIQWNSVRRAEGSGFYTWDTEQVEVPAGEWTVTSAASPVTVRIPVPEGGYYELSATGRDADGRKTRTEVSFYGVGKGYTAWQRYDHNRIDLEPEKKTWKPGETARLMIQSPWESATALLTVEREGIRRYERFRLTSTQQTVTVPITEADIPNVYVSILLIRGRTSDEFGRDGSDPGKPAFRLGYAELKVEDTTKKLAVAVSADRAEYRPANVATVAVSVTDSANRPTASEVTLWAVDYGILSLTGYRAPDVVSSVYREKALQVMNEDNRQRIVSRRVLTPKGDGEGGGGGGEDGVGGVRRDFRPLAFWLGSVETDATGKATREVTLPEALTTYRIMAVAGDASSRFGSAAAEIKVNKPVTLLAAFPRFMTLGDRATFGGVVSNTLPSGGGAVVTIRSLDTGLLQFQGAASQTIQLAAGATEPVRFDATARGVGTARVQMTVSLGNETDAFEATLPVSAPSRLETTAAFGDTDSRAVERLAMPSNVIPTMGGLNVSLASTALVGLGEGARYIIEYPYGCAEQKASAAFALMLAADLGSAFNIGTLAPADARSRAMAVLRDLEKFQCADGGFGYWPGNCLHGSVYLTSYLLHVMKVTSELGVAQNDETIQRALTFLEGELKNVLPPGQVQWQPVWSAGNAFSVKVLAEYGRNQDSNINRLLGIADRMPIFALSYLADALAASNLRDARYDDVVRRITNALRIEGDRAHVEELDPEALVWVWSSNVRSTALVLEGFARRGDDPVFIQRMVRWLLLARQRGRWGNTQENATALEALVAYYRKFEAEIPNMSATVAIGTQPVGTAAFRERSALAQQVRLAMPDLLQQIPAGAERDLAVSRAGVGRLFYTARLQYALTEPAPPSEQGIRIERSYERFVEGAGPGQSATTFSAGDLIRITLTLSLPQERRYVAVTDSLPAGVEAVDSWFRTTASDLARDASVQTTSSTQAWWFERDGFDHVEKYDDKVALFATRLAGGRHQFSYLVRATTSGTFKAAGAIAEEMYAPEVQGRTEAATVEIR